MLTLGQKIKSIRKEQGLTQAELVGDRITRNQLSLIENGINNPSISTLEFLASRLNVPMSYFLSNDDFSMHKCQKLITKSEAQLEAGKHTQVVYEIEEFLNNINNQNDSTMGDLLGKVYALLGTAYINVDKSKAKECLLEAIRLLEPTDQVWYLSKACNYLGILYDDENDWEQADYYLTKAHNLITNVSLDNIILKLNIAYNISYLYTKQGRYQELIDFITENLKYSNKYKIFHNFGIFNMLLSIAYRYTFDYNKAIICMQKAIEFFQFSDDENNKYTGYINLGVFFRLAGDYESSIKYLEMSRKYFEYTEKIAKALNAKAELIKTQFLSNKRDENFARLLNELINDINDSNENKPDLLTIKGVCLLEDNNFEEALKMLSAAEALEKNPKQSEFIAYTYIGLSKVYKHNQQWEDAYTYLDKANELPHKAKCNINFE